MVTCLRLARVQLVTLMQDPQDGGASTNAVCKNYSSDGLGLVSSNQIWKSVTCEHSWNQGV